MKLLFIAAKLNQFGGIEKYNRNLIVTFRELGQDVIVVERQLGGLLVKTSFFIRVMFSAVGHRPDFIVCTHLNFSPLCYWLKKILRIKYSVSVYGVEVANIQRRIFKQALSNATCIIYLFETTANRVVGQIPDTKSKLFNIPSSIDGEMFCIKERLPSLISRFGLSNSKVVVTIGRMSKLDGDNKGYRRVIKAMPKVLKDVPNAKYLLAGSGDDVSGVKQLITELKLEKNVILADAPSNEELADYYNLADVFVLPSKNEGFPAIVLLEALSCGVPVIGGNQNSTEKAFLNGELVLIVPPNDIDAIAKAIIKMLKKEVSPGLLAREEIREKTLHEYGMESYRKRIKDFLDLIKR